MRCRLCGAEAAEFVSGGAGYGECPVCGYIGVEPSRLPSPEAEEARYRLHRNSRSDSRYVSWILEFVEAVEPYLRPGGELLDFGSGPEPVPAALLRERGYPVLAYDPFFAPGDDWRSRAWDAVLVHEVAEHLAEPGAALAELAALLRPGGALCVRTRFPPRDREAFARWRYRMDSTHVGFFRPESFAWLSARLGLRAALVEPPDRAVLVRPA